MLGYGRACGNESALNQPMDDQCASDLNHNRGGSRSEVTMFKYKLNAQYKQLIQNLLTGDAFRSEDAFHDSARIRQRAVTDASQLPAREAHQELLEKLVEAGLLTKEPID